MAVKTQVQLARTPGPSILYYNAVAMDGVITSSVGDFMLWLVMTDELTLFVFWLASYFQTDQAKMIHQQ